MLIEFAGHTGSGKTTLVNAVRGKLSERGHRPAVSTDILSRATGTSWIPSGLWRNLALNFLLIPWFLKSLWKHARLYPYAVRFILRDAGGALDTANRLRSAMRLLAAQELLRGWDSAGGLVLVDEGPLGCMHNFFVHTDKPPPVEEVCRFVALAPLPDLVVHVDAPVEVALSRTLGRAEKPLRGARTAADFRHFIEHGREVFRTMRACEAFEGRIITVSNEGHAFAGVEAIADAIVEFILQKAGAADP